MTKHEAVSTSNKLSLARLPALAALGAALFVAGCDKPHQQKEASLPNWSDVAKLPSVAQLPNTQSVLDGIERGEFSHQILEASGPEGSVFTYVLAKNSDATPVILRGVQVGPERETFLKDLNKIGVSPRAKITGDASSVTVLAEERPWYSQIGLISSYVLMISIAVVSIIEFYSARITAALNKFANRLEREDQDLDDDQHRYSEK